MIRKQLGLQTDGRRAGPKETGVAQMMVDLVRSYQEPLSQEHLFLWHKMIMNGRIDLEMIGGYRAHAANADRIRPIRHAQSIL